MRNCDILNFCSHDVTLYERCKLQFNLSDWVKWLVCLSVFNINRKVSRALISSYTGYLRTYTPVVKRDRYVFPWDKQMIINFRSIKYALKILSVI